MGMGIMGPVCECVSYFAIMLVGRFCFCFCLAVLLLLLSNAEYWAEIEWLAFLVNPRY